MTNYIPILSPPPHRPLYEVSIETWRKSSSFKDFLTFAYRPSPAIAAQAAELLPIAIAQERMLGSLQILILNEAIGIWNAPEQMHHFYHNLARKWVYKGTDLKDVGYLTMALHGRLNAPLKKGQFCLPPFQCMITTQRYPLNIEYGDE